MRPSAPKVLAFSAQRLRNQTISDDEGRNYFYFFSSYHVHIPSGACLCLSYLFDSIAWMICICRPTINANVFAVTKRLNLLLSAAVTVRAQRLCYTIPK